MNIVITNISKLPNAITPKTYSVKVEGCDIDSLSAIQTNESIIKAFAEIRAIKQSGGIGKIIMLASNVVLKEKDSNFQMTALEYYKKESKACCGISEENFHIIKIENENNTQKSNAEILNEICKQISPDDVVYIDSAGGARTISNLIQLLTKILLYRGIKNPLALYSNIQNVDCTIEDTSDFVRMSNLADGFNEFMTTGKADQIKQCFESVKDANPKLLSIIESMNNFSDNIRLGKVDDIGEIITSLQNQIDSLGDIVDTSIESVIFRQFISDIQRKIIGESRTQNGVDYLRIVRWCLDNLLIQQALTIFVEKMPITLFDNGIIRYKGNYQQAKNNHKDNKKPLDSYDWETYYFYSVVLETTKEQPELLVEFKEALRCDNKEKTSDKVKGIVKSIKSFKSKWKFGDNTLCKNSEIRKLINSKGYKTYKKFKNDLLSGTVDKDICDWLGVSSPTDESIGTTERKFKAINSILKGNTNEEYAIAVPYEKFAAVCYGYIYVKNVRNNINHASSDEKFTNAQRKILENYGYDFARYDLKTVRANIEKAINVFADCIKIGSGAIEKVQEEKSDDSFAPTSLAVGDTVQAECIEKKIVRLKDCNYNVQLVLTPGADADSYVGKKFPVKIKQISKKGKIIQVKLP